MKTLGTNAPPPRLVLEAGPDPALLEAAAPAPVFPWGASATTLPADGLGVVGTNALPPRLVLATPDPVFRCGASAATLPAAGLGFEGADASSVEGVELEGELNVPEGTAAAWASARSLLFRASAAAASPSDCAEIEGSARKAVTRPTARAEQVRIIGSPPVYTVGPKDV